MTDWIVAAEFFTTQQVCKILSTVRDRIQVEDWTAVCWSNKTGITSITLENIVTNIFIILNYCNNIKPGPTS